VFGLAQVEGTQNLLEKVAREDEQWIVRMAATTAIDELEEQKKISGVAPPPEIDQLPWLISWAATQGEGVGLGDAARRMLRRALIEGDAPTRLAAIQVVTQMGRPDDVEPLRTAMTGSEPDAVSAAMKALAEISERYALRIK
jgi:HEAT repeat protein